MKRYINVVIAIVIISIIFLLFVCFEYMCFQGKDTWIIAHRGGGTLNVENSMLGIESAINRKIYGSEIDVQRTKDGYYVINHDENFERLSKVNRKAQEMTLEEIKNLKIKNRYGEADIATIEEMLDVSKGRIKLFIELKGVSADKKMADDLVFMLKERNMLNDCVLISLKYDVIDYIETQYPEATTGYLCSSSLNLIIKFNYDYLLVEEKIASKGLIMVGHLLGKKVIVWTVDEASSINYFLDSNVDGIITNEVKKTESIKLNR